ncbi:hypothetical protein [Alphaproteobacteria bacterium endosymbiont of Tiliacea citrago]|uniref:hypothetical protein n=1 Tax=Alphaproteobacteria bacterium endosymbiont of Tiliacea citrago TaxID=3077944 RepID=UPI00313B36E4
MKIKEILLAGLFVSVSNWSPPKEEPQKRKSPQLDWKNIKEPRAPELLRVNAGGVPCVIDDKFDQPVRIANEEEIKAWNKFWIYQYIFDGKTEEEAKKEKCIIVEDKDGNEIYI